jgi:hypothetical protein
MLGLLVKSTLIGFVLGILCTFAYSLITASADGRNVQTGEPMHLRGYQAIYVHLNDYGLSSYLTSLMPSFILFVLISSLISGLVLYWFNGNA